MRHRLAAIDVLRGVAILLVVHQHVTSKFVTLEWRLMHPALVAIPTNGFYGVNVFFALSGFVLFLPWVQSHVTGREHPVGRFYRRRSMRILPLYYLSVAVAFLLWIDWSHPARGAFWHLGMVASFLFQFSQLHFFPRFNPVLWSLGVEVCFSALLPVLAGAALRCGMGRVLVAAILLATVTRLVGTAVGWWLPLTDGLFGRIDDFMVGMAAAWVFVVWSPTRRPWLAIAAGLLLVETACVMSNVWAVAGAWKTRAVVVPSTLNAGVFVLLRGMLAPTMAVGWRPLEMLGRMSYSIYLWHVVVRDHVLGKGGVQSALDLLLYVAVLLGVSAVTYRLVELRMTADGRAPAPAR